MVCIPPLLALVNSKNDGGGAFRTLPEGGIAMFYFPDLTEPVRALMLEEVKMDKDAGVIITSKRLTPQGEVEYPGLLEQAVKSHDPGWLAKMLDMGGRIKTQEPRIVRGRTQMVKVPFTAAQNQSKSSRFQLMTIASNAAIVDAITIPSWIATWSTVPVPCAAATARTRFIKSQLRRNFLIFSWPLVYAISGLEILMCFRSLVSVPIVFQKLQA